MIRRRTAVVACLLALVLGAVTGWFLVPDRSTMGWDRLPWDSGSPTARRTPSATAEASASYAVTPPTGRDLLTVKAFRSAGLETTVYPQNGNTSPDFAVTACTDERTVGARTLGDITGHDPEVYGTWDEPATTATADEVITMAESPAEAQTAAARLLAAQTTCQHEPVHHWVYGPTRQRQLSSGVWAAWVGSYPARQNTTGQAPADAEPCGGVAILRNGQRVGVLEVFMCADSDQLASLATAAATQLG